MRNDEFNNVKVTNEKEPFSYEFGNSQNVEFTFFDEKKDALKDELNENNEKNNENKVVDETEEEQTQDKKEKAKLDEKDLKGQEVKNSFDGSEAEAAASSTAASSAGAVASTVVAVSVAVVAVPVVSNLVGIDLYDQSKSEPSIVEKVEFSIGMNEIFAHIVMNELGEEEVYIAYVEQADVQISDQPDTRESDKLVTGDNYCSFTDLWPETTYNFYIKETISDVKVYETTVATRSQSSAMCTITFLPGEHGVGDSYTDEWYENDYYYLPSPEFEPEPGYIFDGWLVEGQPEVLDIESEVYITSDITVIAQWAVAYTVSFDPGEGSGSMDSEVVKAGSTYYLPDCDFTAPEDGTFDYWEVSTIAGRSFAVGDYFEVEEDTVVTAIWSIDTPPSQPVINDVSFNTTIDFTESEHDVELSLEVYDPDDQITNVTLEIVKNGYSFQAQTETINITNEISQTITLTDSYDFNYASESTFDYCLTYDIPLENDPSQTQTIQGPSGFLSFSDEQGRTFTFNRLDFLYGDANGQEIGFKPVFVDDLSEMNNIRCDFYPIWGSNANQLTNTISLTNMTNEALNTVSVQNFDFSQEYRYEIIYESGKFNGPTSGSGMEITVLSGTVNFSKIPLKYYDYIDIKNTYFTVDGQDYMAVELVNFNDPTDYYGLISLDIQITGQQSQTVYIESRSGVQLVPVTFGGASTVSVNLNVQGASYGTLEREVTQTINLDSSAGVVLGAYIPYALFSKEAARTGFQVFTNDVDDPKALENVTLDFTPCEDPDNPSPVAPDTTYVDVDLSSGENPDDTYYLYFDPDYHYNVVDGFALYPYKVELSYEISGSSYSILISDRMCFQLKN